MVLKTNLVMHIMESVFCMYNFTTIKGYFSSCQSLLYRMTVLNSNVLKGKNLIQQDLVYLDMSLHGKP